MTLFFEVLIMPPIIYESSLSLIHNARVMSRLGSLCILQVLTILVTTAWLLLPDLLFKNLKIFTSVPMALLIQVNDYVGTVEPHVQMAVTNYEKNEESLSFLAFSSILKNCFLIFICVNIMPETRPKEG